MLVALFVVAVLLLGNGVSPLHADTYITFRGARYYSPNRQAFIEVTAAGRATVYRNKRGGHQLWSRRLAAIPASILVTDDGNATILVDGYYGNGGAPNAQVLSFRDRIGREFRSYRLDSLVRIDDVSMTTSSAHWCLEASLTDDQQYLKVVTAKRKCVPPSAVSSEVERQLIDDCYTSIPSEVLRFDLETGSLVERKAAT